jgi:hypothetical protein
LYKLRNVCAGPVDRFGQYSELKRKSISTRLAVPLCRSGSPEVLSGLRDVLHLCADPQKFTRALNKELRQIWEASSEFKPDAGERIAAIDRKIENIRRAVEEGLNDAGCANTRLRELNVERESIVTAFEKASGLPQLDVATAVDYRRQADKLLQHGGQADRKQLLRTLVGEVKLMPQDLEVSISYRLPEASMKGLVAGDGFEPPTFGL